jgi:hypothetical protein
MAVPEGLPSDVVQFVNDSIDSIEQLELLAVLVDSSQRYWDPASAGRALGVLRLLADELKVALLGLVAPEAESRSYVYGPRLLAFLLVIAAIIGKNRGSSR